MKQEQTSSFSSSQPSQSLGSSLRCSDFNYQNRNTKNYYGEADRLGMNYRRQPLCVQERKQSTMYTRHQDKQQYTELQYKRDSINMLSSRSPLNKEKSNYNYHDTTSPQVNSTNSELYQYQTPQKVQQSYHSRSYTTSFSDQWGQQSETKQEKQSPLGDNKEQLKQKYLRYTTEHSRYTVSAADECSNSINNEEIQANNQRLSKQEQRKLMDSPTKENEQINLSDKQNNLQSYSGFISRTQNTYYKRSPNLESPSKEDKSILRDSYSKVLNYKTTSAYTRDSSPQQMSSKSFRASQSEKKNFTEEIEQYKQELKEYQSQLSSYQEQLRNTLNKNRIELFDGLSTKREDPLTSSISTYSKASFLDLKSSTTFTRSINDQESSKKVGERENDANKITRLTESIVYSKPLGQSGQTERDLFASINIDSNSFNASPEKVLDVINLDLSTTVPLIKCESEYVTENTHKSIIKLRKVANDEDNSFQSSNNKVEQKQNTILVNPFNIGQDNVGHFNLINENVSSKYARSSSSYREEPVQKQNTSSKNQDCNNEYQNKQRSSSTHSKIPMTSSSALGYYSDISEKTTKIELLSQNNKDPNQQLSYTQNIGSVNNDKEALSVKEYQKVQNSNQTTKEESSTSLSHLETDLQKQKLDTSENIIKNKQDKLKEIENRYKRVEEISKKYSHLYKSKLLSSNPTFESSKSTTIASSLSSSAIIHNSISQPNNTYKKQEQPSPTSLSSSTSTGRSENNTQISTCPSISSEINIKQENQKMNNTSLFHNMSVSQTDTTKQSEQEKQIKSMTLTIPNPINIRQGIQDKEICYFVQQTPRFQTMDGEEYFKTAEEILQLNRQNANKLDQTFCSTDRVEETLQNLSQNEINCDLSDESVVHTFRQQDQQSPSVSSL